jgi:hypothetical protein
MIQKFLQAFSSYQPAESASDDYDFGHLRSSDPSHVLDLYLLATLR